MLMINNVVKTKIEERGIFPSYSINMGYRERCKNRAKKKGGGKSGNPSYTTESKRSKNVTLGSFHDVYDNTASYTPASTICMKINGIF